MSVRVQMLYGCDSVCTCIYTIIVIFVFESQFGSFCCVYRIGQKNEATLHFPKYLANCKSLLYLHTSRPLYSEHAYNIRVYSFYYLKWRHLVNCLPLYNATLKIPMLITISVGRCLLHRKGEHCLWIQGQGQRSISVKVFG